MKKDKAEFVTKVKRAQLDKWPYETKEEIAAAIARGEKPDETIVIDYDDNENEIHREVINHAANTGRT